MNTPYHFRVPHKPHTRYEVCINGAIQRVTKKQYKRIDEILGAKSSIYL